MGVKRKIVFDKTPMMKAAAKQLNGRQVQVGAKGEHAWLARIHEYGCTITVTEKMEAWLHYHGVHLRPSTHHIVIPERSFMRAGFDMYHQSVLDQADMLVARVLDGTLQPRTVLDRTGAMLRDKIRDYATDLKSPPDTEFTVKQKGSSNPLVDTGAMIAGISYEVK